MVVKSSTLLYHGQSGRRVFPPPAAPRVHAGGGGGRGHGGLLRMRGAARGGRDVRRPEPGEGGAAASASRNEFHKE